MEKYRKFADAGSGINPFIEAKQKKTSKLAKYTLGLVLFLIRLPFVLFLFFWICVYQGLGRKFIAVPALRRTIDCIVLPILYRMLLLTFGFLSINTKITSFKKNENLASTNSIILCNHTHPLDFALLTSKICPTFTKIYYKTKSATEKDAVLEPLPFGCSLKYFFTRFYHLPVSASETEITQKYPGQKFNVSDLAKRQLKDKEGPLVILFEGAYTIGKGVLAINENLAGEIYEYQKETDRNTMLISISYSDNANAVTSSPIISTLALLFNFTNSATIKVNYVTKLPIQRKDMARTIHEFYEQGHGLVKLNVSTETYLGFLDYWNETQKKGYVAKREKDE